MTARTVIPITSITENAYTADVAGTNLDATNDHYFTPAAPLEEYLVRVSHTTNTSKTLSVLAGDSPPSMAAGQGNLDAAFADGSGTPVVKFIHLESGRFLQDDGTVNIDVPSGMTGTITVFHIPRA